MPRIGSKNRIINSDLILENLDRPYSSQAGKFIKTSMTPFRGYDNGINTAIT